MRRHRHRDRVEGVNARLRRRRSPTRSEFVRQLVEEAGIKPTPIATGDPAQRQPVK